MKKRISLWRLARETSTYHANDISGMGAKVTGGRWNHPGIAVVYAATNISIAALEVAVHGKRLAEVRNLYLVEISVRAEDWHKREEYAVKALPPTWNSVPDSKAARDLGSHWLNGKSELLLSVPSVVIPEEHNVLINVNHPNFKHVTSKVVRQFYFDPRLAK